eukprot:CAMPEP_0204179754 /NCGR_PEP_ID=MMETSP0361-20130328/50425_1 /ASSEMBLY_ACC=CAM_ASM_000343 /TAXON_ID=268821 /ORGANISM="Scrippsiella Hangoei, Strain SHTV-5" /LENGTH=138 /DNA_ID=CAMNT_0051139067 /DNA_START=12 /DNA_END=425 /DNA_ORIENTATION=-
MEGRQQRGAGRGGGKAELEAAPDRVDVLVAPVSPQEDPHGAVERQALTLEGLEPTDPPRRGVDVLLRQNEGLIEGKALLAEQTREPPLHVPAQGLEVLAPHSIGNPSMKLIPRNSSCTARALNAKVADHSPLSTGSRR